MGIAGFLGHSDGKPEVLLSLGKLALKPTNEKRAATVDHVVMGAVGDALLWRSGSLIVAFEGVLFEQRALRSSLGAAPEEGIGELILRAYRTWGDTFPDALDGEFALALWDSERHLLLLAKDALGRGPLHYAETGKGFAFSSEPRGLVGWPGVDDRIDEQMIARNLSVQAIRGRTMHVGIHLLIGGHILTVQNGYHPQLTRYWHPLKTAVIYAKDSREYSEALRSALVRAVSVRLPASGLVGSHLSSGFDSSGVTALAAQALLNQNRPLVAYTAVPVQDTDAEKVLKNRFHNEWPLAAKVAAKYPNIEHVAIRNDAADWLEALDRISDGVGNSTAFIRNSRWYYGILQDAAQRGLGTLLQGQAGNLTSSYEGGFGLYDLRKRGKWRQLYAAMCGRHSHGERWASLVHSAWMPSSKTRIRLQRLRRRHVPKLFELSLMRPAFYAASGLPQLEFSAMGAVVEGDRHDGRSWRLSLIEAGDWSMMGAMEMRLFGIRREDPTADRRLIELCLSIPDEAFCPQGLKRDLYREALRNDLPHELLGESKRGLQSSDFLQMFEAWLPAWGEEISRLETSAASRYLDVPRMRRLLEDWPRLSQQDVALADLTYNYTFGGALSLGRFLRLWEESGGGFARAGDRAQP